MKKFATALVSVLAVVVLALTMAACSKVDGKTYVFDSLEVNGEVVTSGEEYENYKDICIKFDDGKVYAVEGEEQEQIGTYTQDGKTVSAAGVKYTVKGSKLISETTIFGNTMKVTLKKK